MPTPEERDNAIIAGLGALGKAVDEGDEDTANLLAFHLKKTSDKADEEDDKGK